MIAMTEWIEYTKAAGAFVGAAGIATLAKLYHNRVIKGKETELILKDAEVARIKADLHRAEERLKNLDASSAAEGSLSKLRNQLNELVEQLARAMSAQAASLYIPVFSTRDDISEFPRGFAFVAAYNIDPAAAAAILRIKLVESWTIVGECWAKDAVIIDHELQANTRHVASYDNQSGFKPVNTLVAPVRWQNRIVGVIQFFNKTRATDPREIDNNGFSAEDRKNVAEALHNVTDNGLAGKTHYFQSNPDSMRLLGLQGESTLENAIIMYVDLTRSSALFAELALLDAARMINRFSEHVYQQMSNYGAVVEKFNGDGTMIRFHYGVFDPALPASNPAFRAVCAAAELVDSFAEFKARRWRDVASNIADDIKLRITVALGPVISTNVGPRQFQVPTVMGPCVNRSAKMISYAPRDRDIILVDDNARKALLQVDRSHAQALPEFDRWIDAGAMQNSSMARHGYFEAVVNHFVLAASRAQRPTKM